MEYATVRGTAVPKIGLGTWELSGHTCKRVVSTALDLGYRHVDTAQLYENEAMVGEAIAESPVDREAVFLTTKVSPRNARYEDLLASVDESLDRLDTDYVDLLLLHWPVPTVPLSETMRAMNEVIDRGQARHIGVSNFSAGRLDRARRASDAPILTDQVLFHPFKPQRELLRYCQDEDVILTAYSPLARGGVVTDDLLETIGHAYEKSPAQVALRWATLHSNVVAIPKSTSRGHLEENIDIFDFELTREELDRIARPSLLRTGTTWIRGQLGV